MTTAPKAPGRLYSAAGDGYYESSDYGDTWKEKENGLRQHYLYCVSVHPRDPDTVIVSASPGPWLAYNPQNPESYVYRKTHGREWKRVKLDPEKDGKFTVSVFAPNPEIEGEFYAANSSGVYNLRMKV